MNKIIFLFFALAISLHVFAEGWRKGEMEVIVRIMGQEDAIKLHSLRLNGEIGIDHAILYVTPEELLQIRNSGLEYEIRIADLNVHYRGFWDLRAEYHSYEEIIELMDSLELHFPDICKKYDYGTSIGGLELAALKISDSVDLNQIEPEIAFDGGIHGDEIGGAENLVRFARHLCVNYGTDPEITNYIDQREIWIYPMVNPDGRVNMTRYNMNGIDLNRDWGYMWDGWGNSPEAYSQIETRALRQFMIDHQFSFHTAFHSGLEMMLYPWYYRQDDCPDYDAISFLGLQYSIQSGYTNLPNYSGFTAYGTNGTAAECYYGVMGSYGFTMEISEDKQPPASQLMHYYNINVAPMLMFIEQSGYGIQGVVEDAITGVAIQARITVNDHLPVYTDSINGDYHKFLIPGVYSIKAMANGYESQLIENVNTWQDSVTTLNIQMTALDSARQYAHRVISCQIPGNNWADEGNTPASLGGPDSINYSIGKDGWIVVDMQYGIPDQPGNDIIVYEGDATPEAYELFGGNSMDGPWSLIGTGYGSNEFDLLGSGQTLVRYLKIIDDGDGLSNAPDAGFDLDAVSDLEHVDGIHLVMMNVTINDSSGNNNGVIDAGESVSLNIEIANNGGTTANDIIGNLQTSSSFINITQPSASFGTLMPVQAANASFSLDADASTPIGEPVTFTLDLTASAGTYQNAVDFELNIGRFPVLIIDLDQNTSSGPVMLSTLEDLDIIASYLTSIPDDLYLYKCIFLCLGVYGSNHILSTTEGLQLADYLDNRGNLYMEGGDTWSFDAPTPVHPMFNILGFNDGYDDLDFILGTDGTFTSGMHYQYEGDNSSIDRILPINDAFVLFYNQVPMYNNCIANDSETYKTIGASFEFGGLQDGASTKAELMYKILDFFGNIVTNTQENHIKDKVNLKTYPNPLRDHTNILFTLDSPERVTINIYNLNGQMVRNLCDNQFVEGMHQIQWDGTDQNHNQLSSGIYLMKMQVNGAVYTGKIAIIE